MQPHMIISFIMIYEENWPQINILILRYFMNTGPVLSISWPVLFQKMEAIVEQYNIPQSEISKAIHGNK